MTRPIPSVLAGLAGFALCGSALAHTGTEVHAHTDFLAGLLHPFSGIDHLCAMLAVGMWSAVVSRHGGRDLLWGPLAFAALMLVGAVLGLQGVQVPAVEPMIAASLMACGLLLATRLRLGALRTAAAVGLFALFHGLAHGDELRHSANAVPALAGMLVGTALLHACGLAVGWTLRGTRSWAVGLAGGSVALTGTYLLLQLA